MNYHQCTTFTFKIFYSRLLNLHMKMRTTLGLVVWYAYLNIPKLLWHAVFLAFSHA